MSITCRNVVLPSPSPDSNQVFSLLRIARLSRPNTSRQTARMSSGIRGGLPFTRPEPGTFGEPGLRPERFGAMFRATARDADPSSRAPAGGLRGDHDQWRARATLLSLRRVHPEYGRG